LGIIAFIQTIKCGNLYFEPTLYLLKVLSCTNCSHISSIFSSFIIRYKTSVDEHWNL